MVRKREYQEVNIEIMKQRNKRDDGSNRMWNRKIPNPYIRPPDQVNRGVKLIFLNRYHVDRRIDRKCEVGGHGNIETLV